MELTKHKQNKTNSSFYDFLFMFKSNVEIGIYVSQHIYCVCGILNNVSLKNKIPCL